MILFFLKHNLLNYKNNHIDKEDLTALLESGGASAFETIFRLYYVKLLHIAKNYLGNKENAEEIVQNVFLKLWQEIDNLNKIENINGYLFMVTRNACFDFLKHEKVKTNYIFDVKKSIQFQYVKDEASSLLLENELAKKINEGIDLLPEKCRKIFIHSRFDGLKSREIAQMYSISKRTVDNHIAKGISHMKFHLRDFVGLITLFFSFFGD